MRKGRVIFGELKHRILELPNVPTTRPTSDALKEAMFNCLIHRFNIDFKQWTVIDAFAGSGALGIETLSLGSSFALFFEQNPVAYRTICKNISSLNLNNRSLVLRADVTKYNLNKILPVLGQRILVILDPPYKEVSILNNQIDRFFNLFRCKDIVIIAETDSNTTIGNVAPSYVLFTSGNKKAIILSNSKC